MVLARESRCDRAAGRNGGAHYFASGPQWSARTGLDVCEVQLRGDKRDARHATRIETPEGDLEIRSESANARYGHELAQLRT